MGNLIRNGVSYSGGSSEIESEVIDIRLKADGTKATSAGNAVREQVTELKSDLSNKLNIKYPATEVIGYLDVNGNIYNDSDYHSFVTDYIPVSNGDSFYYKGKADSNVASVVLYYEDKSVLSYKQVNSVDDYTIIDIDINCYYARFNSYAPIGENIIFSLSKTSDLTGECIDYLIEKNSSDLEELYTLIKDKNIKFEPFFKEESPIGNGTFKTYECWYRSDYIQCISGKEIQYHARCHKGANIVPIAFYDENKEFILGVSPSKVDGAVDGTIIVPDNAKYFIVSSFKNNSIGDVTTANCLYPKKYNLDDIEIIKKEINNFSTILCIGDSLTEGDYGSEPSGTINVHSENYPYFLSKQLNCNVVNKGRCGFTPVSYWDNMIKNIDFSTISPKIVVIMLGTNGSMTDTLSTDVEPYDDYNNYANTGTGDYCKIIEYINEQTNGECQIVLCTCPFVDSSRRSGYANNVNNANVVIPKIANRYNLPLIDVNKELGLSSMNTNIFQPIDGLHFGRIGYSKLGTFIGSKLRSIHSFVYPDENS